MQAIVSDTRSQELLENLKRERSVASFTSQDQINSRRSAEKILGPDENLFRVDWVNPLITIVDYWLTVLIVVRL